MRAAAGCKALAVFAISIFYGSWLHLGNKKTNINRRYIFSQSK